MSARLELRRARIAAAVDHLLELLDQLDGDPDLEPEPDDDDAEDEAWHQPLTLAPPRIPARQVAR
jgi:hypothetical protein